MKYLTVVLLLAAYILVAGEFDLFQEKSMTDESVFKDYKSNKFRASYSLFPSEQKKFGISFSRYLTRKLGFIIELDQSEYGTGLKEKSEFIIGATYKFTKRARTWVFLGDLGLSVNDDIEDDEGNSKGFKANHLYGRFCAEYVFTNGFGIDFSMVGRMPLEFDLDEDVSPIHSIGLLYQF